MSENQEHFWHIFTIFYYKKREKRCKPKKKFGYERHFVLVGIVENVNKIFQKLKKIVMRAAMT